MSTDKNTAALGFERASRTRYDFGSLYRNKEGEVCLKLNLQIRFTK